MVSLGKLLINICSFHSKWKDLHFPGVGKLKLRWIPLSSLSPMPSVEHCNLIIILEMKLVVAGRLYSLVYQGGQYGSVSLIVNSGTRIRAHDSKCCIQYICFNFCQNIVFQLPRIPLPIVSLSLFPQDHQLGQQTLDQRNVYYSILALPPP